VAENLKPNGGHRPAASGDKRYLSALEFLAGAFVVIAHNVYRILPNEVPILVALGLLSIWLRKSGWSALGFRRPPSWLRVLQIALAAAALRILLGQFVVDPLAARIWAPEVAPAGSEDIAGSLTSALQWLLVVWTFAAFGEEIAYRGYLLSRAADLGHGSPAAWWIGMVLVSILFGFGHYYKGPAGIVDSGVAGVVLGAAYLLSGRNLWVSILAHGFIDTFWILALSLGWQS
jgi:membrane protease YdiL (CAAX protease family)